MSILTDLRQVWHDTTTNLDGFGVEIKLIAPTGEEADVAGLHTKHAQGFDPETGRPVSSKNAHVSVTEIQLMEAYYPYRNQKGEVKMRDHKVEVKDSTGLTKQYKVNDAMPDETLGVIVMILGDYGTN